MSDGIMDNHHSFTSRERWYVNTSKNAPEEFRVTTTPMLSFRNASMAIEFYKESFGVVEITCMVDDSNGKVTHAEIRIGDSPIMLSRPGQDSSGQ